VNNYSMSVAVCFNELLRKIELLLVGVQKVKNMMQKSLSILVGLFVCFGINAQMSQPNIIMLLADDLSQSDLKGADTPNLDRLAREGMTFSQGYAVCTVCSPSRASIMTGRNYAELGITTLQDPVPDHATFISQKLSDAGYVTGALGKWHIKRKGDASLDQPTDFGFDFQKGVNHGGMPGSYFYPYQGQGNKNNYINDLMHHKPETFLTHALGMEGADFISENKDKPFFLYASFYAVHTPVMGPKDKVDKYKKAGHKQPEFAALVESIDDAVGTILDAVEKAGIADNTVIFFAGDNGGFDRFSDNRPFRSGKGSHYEGGLRVPTIVKWPGMIQPNSVCDEPVVGYDYAGTWAEMAGIEWDGTSLVPLLKNPDASLNREALYWYYLPLPKYVTNKNTERVPALAMRKDDWKIIRFLSTPHKEEYEELYNLKEDISEKMNLAKVYPEKLKQFSAEMDKWLASMPIEKFNAVGYSKEVEKVMKSHEKK
jgi:arylsulfatase A-like enzyme